MLNSSIIIRMVMPLALGLCVSSTARAEPTSAYHVSGAYKLDVMDVADGGLGTGARALGDLTLNLDVDLDAAVGWRATSIHVSAIGVHGGEPNSLAGTLGGIDNIEVDDHGARLYEAWIDRSLIGGAIDVRFGLYDTNTEFDVTDSAGLFLGSTYGMSTEIGATGPAGPATFPSTALALRVALQPRKDVYLRFAAVDAQAGDVGDANGVDVRFSSGAILLSEVGWTGAGKVAVGVWGYTHGQPDVSAILASGAPKLSASRGVYLMIDHPIAPSASGPQASAFLRLGISDGDTTPFDGAGAIGIAVSQVFPGRPNSALGLGFSWALLSPKQRAKSADAGVPLADGETAVELTYADKLGDHLTLQPDLQYIHRPAGDRSVGDALVLGLRATASY